jgi:hypothetical protein
MINTLAVADDNLPLFSPKISILSSNLPIQTTEQLRRNSNLQINDKTISM